MPDALTEISKISAFSYLDINCNRKIMVLKVLRVKSMECYGYSRWDGWCGYRFSLPYFYSTGLGITERPTILQNSVGRNTLIWCGLQYKCGNVRKWKGLTGFCRCWAGETGLSWRVEALPMPQESGDSVQHAFGPISRDCIPQWVVCPTGQPHCRDGRDGGSRAGVRLECDSARRH